MAESRKDDVNEMNVECLIQNISRGSVTLDDEDHHVANEKSRDENNMAAPIEVTNNVESLFVASMHQHSQMLKTLADNFANLQGQLLTTNKASTSDNATKIVNIPPDEPCTSRSCKSENGDSSAKKRKLNETNDCQEKDRFDNILSDFDEGEHEEEEEGEIDTNELLADLDDCFGSDEKCSENKMDKLTKVANDGLRTKLNG